MIPKFHYTVSPDIDNDRLNRLFSDAWPGHTGTDFGYLKERSLGYICCFRETDLVGFVNLAWDGNRHAFILDTTVEKRHQRRGIGQELVRRALLLAAEHNVEWVHVDFEEELESFYKNCGFEHTLAGLVHVTKK